MKQQNPTEIEGYKLYDEIGRGTFSRVRIAIDENGNKYACKIIPKHKLRQDGLMERFENEISVSRQLNNQGIVQLFDLLQDTDYFYIIMEYCDYGDLFQYIVQNTRLEDYEVRYFLKQILIALVYIHSHKVIHRDLKPENILICSSGRLKIADFGLSRFVNQSGIANTPCGTTFYAAPECMHGFSYDGRKTDAWSCGVITFAMLVGKLPWTSNNQAILAEQIDKADFEIPSYVCQEAQNIIHALMKPDPNNRLSVEQALQHPYVSSAPDYRYIPAGIPIHPQMISLKHVDQFLGKDIPEITVSDSFDYSRSFSGHIDSYENTLRAIALKEQSKVKKTSRVTAHQLMFNQKKNPAMAKRSKANQATFYHNDNNISPLIHVKRPPSSHNYAIH